jgi:nucleotide-binding universal stress UspA family protein
MEKLTSILAVVERPEEGAIVLDKAVALARHFGARVELLVADRAYARAFASFCAALDYHEVTLRGMHSGRESLNDVILCRARALWPDLVIKAPAGPHPQYRCTLDENDRQLAHDCPVPVMLVRQKPWEKSLRVAVAVDVSDADNAHIARSLMHTAGFLTLGFHGNLDILYCEREAHDETLRMERAVKLAQLVREFHVGCERIQVFTGAPEKMLPPLVAARQYDLLVLGALSRKSGLSSIFGGVTSRLIEASEGDVMLVKAPALAAERGNDRRVSTGEQRANER